MAERKYCSLLGKKVSSFEEPEGKSGVRCAFGNQYVCMHPGNKTGTCRPYELIQKPTQNSPQKDEILAKDSWSVDSNGVMAKATFQPDVGMIYQTQ